VLVGLMKPWLVITSTLLLLYSFCSYEFLFSDDIDWRIKIISPLVNYGCYMSGMSPDGEFDREMFVWLDRWVTPDTSHVLQSDGVTATDVRVPFTPFEGLGEDPELYPKHVLVRVYQPDFVDKESNIVLPILIWFHGGGHTVGSIYDKRNDYNCRRLSQQGNIVVAVEYRLAPEHPFPADLNDAYSVLLWCASPERHPSLVNGNRNKLILGGDSAGGNIAAVLTLMAQKSQLKEQLMFQILVYPSLYVLNTNSRKKFKDAYILNEDLIEFFNDMRFGKGKTDMFIETPYVNPMKQQNILFTRVPPALIITAELDPLLDDGKTYAEFLSRNFGIRVFYHEFPHTVHGFFGFSFLPEWQQALDVINHYLRESTYFQKGTRFITP